MGFSNGYDSGYDDGFADGVKSAQQNGGLQPSPPSTSSSASTSHGMYGGSGSQVEPKVGIVLSSSPDDAYSLGSVDRKSLILASVNNVRGTCYVYGTGFDDSAAPVSKVELISGSSTVEIASDYLDASSYDCCLAVKLSAWWAVYEQTLPTEGDLPGAPRDWEASGFALSGACPTMMSFSLKITLSNGKSCTISGLECALDEP